MPHCHSVLELMKTEKKFKYIQSNPDLSPVNLSLNPELCLISLITNINKTPSICAFPGFMPQFAADRGEA